jgi:RNA polymerase sigma factor (sigma-70 family)
MMAENENLLLERFVNGGDASAFSELVRRHSGLVYGACMRILADSDKAADATQETFFQLLRNAADITGSIPAWLHRVATRRALYAIRTESARRRREARYAADKPLKTTRWQDISVYLDEGMDELDDQTRQILIQHFFEARTTTDIAAEGGMSQPTVSRRIESGVSELREKLKRRGIIVAATALGSLVTQNAAQAAPAVVLKELGKIALAGAQAATASAIGSAATGSAVAGVLTGVKAKIITAAAVAVVGVGGVVTYKQVTRTAEQPESPTQVAKPVAGTRPKAAAPSVRTEQPARTARAATVVTSPETTATGSSTPDEPVVRSSPPDEPAAEATTQNPPARVSSGFTVVSVREPENQDEQQEEPNEPESKERRARSGRRR